MDIWRTKNGHFHPVAWQKWIQYSQRQQLYQYQSILATRIGDINQEANAHVKYQYKEVKLQLLGQCRNVTSRVLTSDLIYEDQVGNVASRVLTSYKIDLYFTDINILTKIHEDQIQNVFDKDWFGTISVAGRRKDARQTVIDQIQLLTKFRKDRMKTI
ncbi:hypothetical protein DPMN_093604 [Dreissena polymorpha]|uniref:Uncharacterized protein n=1 Tax=Dreissena polymorpha TaxID=45954 RepID=A0A9D4L3L9_DREPO|nr:hypothetical protein DPMN_093604 [Dreissena polymorpha]